MKGAIVYVVVCVLALVGTVALSFYMPQPDYRVINCTWAEISPDFTTEMRQACRQARMEQIK